MTPETLDKKAHKYLLQLNNYEQQFITAVNNKASKDELEIVYEQLNSAWKRTCTFVNLNVKGIRLDPAAFEKRVDKLINHAQNQVKDKAQELNHAAESANAEKTFIKEVLTPVLIISTLLLAAAIAALTIL